ncbi:ATP-grasp domain-containing protein [Pectobacterium aquaticum]|uniref:ATP-grasp domain-containing protein n=1 Tax=Pectobacterium aquaticum TaxID=2204145 RepID=UPI000E26EBD1|nr:ATP-grasp domain-containing protein [Pectobacterium aquaticum]RRO07646.1 ATP-grasp domain-containing protein [Pectobacterium aquaticum]UEM39398.1 ATP-grasp domain-containing protein [Pectobacterium aquaticum]
MHAIVFIRSPLFDIYQWRVSHAIQLHVIAQCDLPETSCFASFYHTKSIDQDSEVVAWIDRLITAHPIDYVVCHSEYDLIRSAQLRERLGIEGQRLDSALAYRDKGLMKTYCRSQGIKVADWHTVADSEEFDAAVRKTGFPCVLKPVDGGGSRNTSILRHAMEINDTALHFPLLVEQFIEGKMYHVDGLVEDGEMVFATVSFYTTSCLAWQDGVPLGSVIVEAGSSIDTRMKGKTRGVIAALPPVAQMAFHAEFFLTPDDDIVLCEIAARSGGALVPQAIEKAWGININEHWLRQQQGEKLDLCLPSVALQQSGWFLLPPQVGVLRSLPDTEPPFDWLSHYRFNAPVGSRFRGADSSVSHVAAGVISGRSSQEVEERIEAFSRWLNDNVEWEV